MDSLPLTTMRHFHYHRSIAPMMWVLIGLSSIELLTVHFLLSFLNTWVAAAASLLTGGTIVWLILAVRSMGRLPVLLDSGMLVMRVGTLRRYDISRENIAGLRLSWGHREEKAKSVANLALIAYPNVFLDLKTPVDRQRLGVRTSITSIAHRLDDLPGFVAAMKDGKIP